tara:strand:- start:3286 stop:3471 length:186 start_codon:yes stop_codon:yes gene_type:complete
LQVTRKLIPAPKPSSPILNVEFLSLSFHLSVNELPEIKTCFASSSAPFIEEYRSSYLLEKG